MTDIITKLRRVRGFLHEGAINGDTYHGVMSDLDAAISELVANPQSAAEPPRDRTDFAWDVIGGTESF